MNLRPLGYEHPNRRLNPLPRSPPSLPIAGHLQTGISPVAARVEPSRHVLVTGLVTGADPSTPAMTVLQLHTNGYARAVTFHL